jgi:hypothetical protein
MQAAVKRKASEMLRHRERPRRQSDESPIGLELAALWLNMFATPIMGAIVS